MSSTDKEKSILKTLRNQFQAVTSGLKKNPHTKNDSRKDANITRDVFLTNPLAPFFSQHRTRRQFYNFPWAAPTNNSSWVSRPLISVIIPVYNQADFIKKSIDSVLEEHFYSTELIIVDDGSKDSLKHILDPYKEDPRVIIIHQENRGIAVALNQGFALASGTFITWSSADNFFLPGALKSLADFLLANPSVGLAYANVELIDDRGKPFANSGYRTQDQSEPGSPELLLPLASNTLMESHDNFINACFMYRKDLRDLIGHYRTELLGCEDFDYWLRISQVSRLAHIDSDQIFYQYRLHDQSLTNKLDPKKLRHKARLLVKRAKEESKITSGRLELNLQASAQVDPLILDCLSTTLGEHNVHTNFPAELNDRPNSVEVCKIELPLKYQGLFQKKDSLQPSPDAGTDTISEARGFSAFAFRPPAFEQTLSYAHSTHKFLHGNLAFAPFVITKTKPGEALTHSLIPSTGILPPIQAPAITRRARDCSFFAVTPHADSTSTILIFVPDFKHIPTTSMDTQNQDSFTWTIDVITKAVVNLRQFTFVLFCQNPLQRETADYLNSNLSSNENLRIIDLSPIASQNEDEESDPSLNSHSLMYVLSSVDFILSIKSPKTTLASLLEIRCEAALAALAGIAIVVLTQEWELESAICSDEWLLKNSARLNSDPLRGLSPLFAPIPHLGVLKYSELDRRSFEKSLENLAKIASAIKLGIDQRSLEQWLETQSVGFISKRILSIILAKHP